MWAALPTDYIKFMFAAATFWRDIILRGWGGGGVFFDILHFKKIFCLSVFLFGGEFFSGEGGGGGIIFRIYNLK